MGLHNQDVARQRILTVEEVVEAEFKHPTVIFFSQLHNLTGRHDVLRDLEQVRTERRHVAECVESHPGPGGGQLDAHALVQIRVLKKGLHGQLSKPHAQIEKFPGVMTD
jgi:hypothetical protein